MAAHVSLSSKTSSKVSNRNGPVRTGTVAISVIVAFSSFKLSNVLGGIIRHSRFGIYASSGLQDVIL